MPKAQLALSKAPVSLIAIVLYFAIGFVGTHSRAANVVTLKEDGRNMAILFVHGLEGSAQASFTNEELDPPLSWSDLIAADERIIHQTASNRRSLSQFDLYAIDYSDVFTDDKIAVSVEEMAQQVANALESHGVIREHKHVWILAHSLGGIVIKRILIKWSNAGYHRYIRHILGVSLLGVPSNGAPLANLGDTRFGKLMAKWLGFDARHISDLKTASTTNTFLRGLDNDWSELLAKRDRLYGGFPRISCGYETAAQYRIEYTIWGLVIYDVNIEVVPAIYARTTCDGEAMPINKTHIALPKPINRHDPVEDWLFNAVRTAFTRKAELGQKFNNSDQRGALARLIRHINSGNDRTDSVGMPLIDEHIEVAQSDWLSGIKAKSRQYVGASWADVLEMFGEDNRCVLVDFHDLARRHINISFSNVIACPPIENQPISYVCKRSYC